MELIAYLFMLGVLLKWVVTPLVKSLKADKPKAVKAEYVPRRSITTTALLQDGWEYIEIRKVKTLDVPPEVHYTKGRLKARGQWISFVDSDKEAISYGSVALYTDNDAYIGHISTMEELSQLYNLIGVQYE